MTSPIAKRIRKIVHSLDAEDASLWQPHSGEPRISIVEGLLGAKLGRGISLTRGQIEMAAPGWTRAQAPSVVKEHRS